MYVYSAAHINMSGTLLLMLLISICTYHVSIISFFETPRMNIIYACCYKTGGHAPCHLKKTIRGFLCRS